MRTETLYLVGAGGHCLVVLDSLATLGIAAASIIVLDEDPERIGQRLGSHIVQAFNPDHLAGTSAHICIGRNSARARLAAALVEVGCALRTVIDPRAIVSPSASIGAGSFIAPGAIIAAEATIGQGCIVNHGAIVDHECRLADFVHIAPGATLAGAVTVESEVLVGAGANILPGLRVSAHSVIGAGAVLVEHAADRAVYVGVPARKA